MQKERLLVTGQTSGLEDFIYLLDDVFHYDIDLLRNEYNNLQVESYAGITHHPPGTYGTINHYVSSGYGNKLFDSFEKKYGLSSGDRFPIFVEFETDTFLGPHLDKYSPCWIAIVLEGLQPIRFYKPKETYIGEVTYKVALVNGFQYHEVPISNTKLRRVIFRQMYDIPFDQAKKLIGG